MYSRFDPETKGDPIQGTKKALYARNIGEMALLYLENRYLKKTSVAKLVASLVLISPTFILDACAYAGKSMITSKAEKLLEEKLIDEVGIETFKRIDGLSYNEKGLNNLSYILERDGFHREAKTVNKRVNELFPKQKFKPIETDDELAQSLLLDCPALAS